MPITLEDFLSECDVKRNEDSNNFDIRLEFKKLDASVQEEIVSSIAGINTINRETDTKADQLQKKMYQELKGLFANSASFALKSNTKEQFVFESKNLSKEGENLQIQDYMGDTQPIHKRENDYFVQYHGQEFKATTSLQEGGKYTAFDFQVPNDKQADFLNRLEPLYYERRAAEKKLSQQELAERGMIRELADFIDPTPFSLLASSAFIGKSSFLHLAIGKMNVEELEDFVLQIPYDLRTPYLKLSNANGRKVGDMVTGDKLDIINYFLNSTQEHDNNIENYNQNVHIASIHRSVDESFVKIAKPILQNANVTIVTYDKERIINFDHQQLKEFTDNNMAKLQKELQTIKALNDQELFAQYIKPTLPKFQQDLTEADPKMIEAIKFKRFQIERSAALVADVIDNGHTGNKYKYTNDVNIQNSNGLTIKEMMAISYVASHDQTKLIRAGKPYNSLNAVDKALCVIEAQAKLIDGLYSIRRGYNLDDNEDNKETYKFSPQIDDHNVCPGGTINRLGDALNNIHADVEIRVVTTDSIKAKIHPLLPKIINDYIASARSETAKINLAMQLKSWQETNKMPDSLQAAIHLNLSAILDQNHPIITEVEKDFSREEISNSVAREALKSYKYPQGIITKLAVNIDLATNPDMLQYYKDNRYTEDAKGNYILTIDAEGQRNPGFIKTLLDKDFNLSRQYVKRDGEMLHIASDYLRYNNDLPDKLVPYIAESPRSFNKVLAKMDEDKLNQFVDTAKAIIPHCAEKYHPDYVTRYVANIIKAFPEDKCDQFVDAAKAAILQLSKLKLSRIIDIIAAFPKDKRAQFVDTVKVAILQTLEKNGLHNSLQSGAIRYIIKAFPEDQCDQFVETAKVVIYQAIEKGFNEEVIHIIEAFPENKRTQLIEFSKITPTKKTEILDDLLVKITEHLFGKDYTKNSGRVADREKIHQLLLKANLSTDDFKQINEMTAPQKQKLVIDMANDIKKNHTKLTALGRITGGIMLKEDFSAAPRIMHVKNFIDCSVKPGSSISPPASPKNLNGRSTQRQ